MPTPTNRIEAQLTASIWTNLSADVTGRIRTMRGVNGNGPADVLAGAGELVFALRNGTNSSGGVVGYYSPLHASVRSGWTYGIPVQFVSLDPLDAAAAVTLTAAAGVATATAVGHGRSTGDSVLIAGANQADYNGTHYITVTGVDTFTFPVTTTAVTPATGSITFRRAYVKFYGKVREIEPVPGTIRERQVKVIAYDVIRDLVESDAREVDIQVGQMDDDLLTELLDSLPTTAQPVRRDLDTGLDTYPYAFDNVGSGAKAAALIQDILLSGYSLGAVKGDGTFFTVNRYNRTAGSSAATFSNTMQGLIVPSSLEKVYNRVRATIHPKTVDAAATTVLFSQPVTAASIPAGGSLTVWGSYRDPNVENRLVGGTAVVTPLVATTDYVANSAADGTGSNLTADVAIVTTAFASTAKFVITNNAAVPAFLTKLQIRGKGIYDDGPQTFESYTAKSYGDRPYSLDMPYQDDPDIGQSAADYLNAVYNSLTAVLEAVEIVANSSSTFLTQALAREIGDQITITETVTGVAATKGVIQSVEIETEIGGLFYRCRWGLAPTSPFAFWILGTAGSSELGTTTVLGF